ncbi:ABC transporter ATP-binding protein [Rariglobus hedericola]|uniref:ABC transporter ATP-binding protein n=1 Tax=Rariglobus hedericola TaxID=2597822 RepID=A0A556QS09_9BACT|nr:ABC transporter ATP-binding protein [Rariglobus hedericola]TSJ79425.1 ABC transporter ATP-binding protein [Rariglobus hedericola]
MTPPVAPSASSSAFRRHLWPLLRRHRWAIIAAVILVSLHGGAMTLQNVYPKWLFSEVLEPKNLATSERWHRLAWLIAGYLTVSIFLRMILWHCGYRIFTWARERIVFSLRAQFFRHVNHLCLRFHGEHHSGELFSYLFGTPLANVMQFFQQTSLLAPGAVIVIVSTLGLFWQWDWPIAVLLTVLCALSFWIMIYARNRIKIIQTDYQKTEGAVSGRVADLLRGNKAVKLHSMESSISVDFEQQAELIGRKSYERDVRSHVEWMKQETLTYFGYVSLLALCTWRYLDGQIDLGIVAACLAAYSGLNWPLQQIFNSVTLWAGCSASLDRIGTVLDTASTTPDPVSPVPVPKEPGELRFERVSFHYADGSPILHELDLVIPYGHRVAIVGPSGAGKSTLLQLLLRLYDPAQGNVRIAGIDVRDIAGRDLRRLFGVVPQDTFVFRSTLRDNIRLARPDADDAAIRRACEQANAWEFISRLPEGLDTPVGEGGSSLSGGQRQRIAIARVFLADPPYFVFDEATSALDTLSEQLIQEAIEKNLTGRTALFVAHRLSTVKNCDRILVMEAGSIVQDGSYDELLGRPGLFRELVHGQQLRE